jgi:hypothetical protein
VTHDPDRSPAVGHHVMEAAHDCHPSVGQRAEEIDRPQRVLGIQALGHRGGDRLPQPLVPR